MTIHSKFLSELRNASAHPISIESREGLVYSRRRGSVTRTGSNMARLMLVPEGDGVLDWKEVTPGIPGLARRRRGASAAAANDVISFRKLEPSTVTSFLEAQDARFTPQRGLQRLTPANGLVPAQLPNSGRALLFIHGTFSNGSNVVKSLEGTEHGRTFLADARQFYAKNVFVFDHPTIAVAPWLNAWELEQAVRRSTCQMDIIAHSRGGLVTRWWCEAFDPQLAKCKNAILVGSPLAGTGLAAPPNIRKSLKLLTSYGNAMEGIAALASAAVPVLGIVSTLLHVITSVTSLAAATPVADTIMAMIPGLFAQSRVGNNLELRGLHRSHGTAARYAAIRANYQSDSPGWRFWQYFHRDYLADAATDILFSGPNDLVVDSDSMAFLADGVCIDAKRVWDYGTTSRVHHVNYFDHCETTDFFRKILRL